MNVFNGVLDLALGVGHLNVLHSIDNHVSEEVSLTVEEFAAHAGLGSIDERFSTQSVGFDG